MERPTLLVFTLGAPCESRRRHLLPAGQGAVEERLHRACLDLALSAGRDAGCRLEVCSPEPLDLPADVDRRAQSGRGFGARLGEAVRDAFGAGGGPVVLVGSDVPGLAASHVRRTLELLEEDPDRVVVGPSPDGGFYLLASAEPLDEVFSAVHWCCRETLQSLRHALALGGRDVVLLPPLVDLDRSSDLELWLAGRPAALSSFRTSSFRTSSFWTSSFGGVLLNLLRRILADLRHAHWGTPKPIPPRLSSLRLPPLRAPPVPA